MDNQTAPKAMAFYHPNGLVPAFKQAFKFAGKDGRVATLPDIIAARLASKAGEVAWERYFTTMTAEYVGLSRTGVPIVVVAHGIGPMATLKGILAAYAHQYKDKTRNSRGGRIPQEVFLQLADGVFGEVSVVELEAVWSQRPYNFTSHAITREEIEQQPLWQARLGPSWEEYCRRHEEIADAWYEERGIEAPFMPCILGMDDASNCSYGSREMFDHWMRETPNTAIAHLISVGQLMNSHHDYWGKDYDGTREPCQSFASDVDCHEWSNGTRFAAVRGGEVGVIHPGVDNIRAMMAKNRDRLMQPTSSVDVMVKMLTLMPFGGETFTQYPKVGERMDTYAPEFRVTSMRLIEGGPQTFRTTVGGYHGFFKYGVKEVMRLAPPEANAYLLPADVDIEWVDGDPRYHITRIEWYHVEVDASQRMMREEDLWNDLDLMLELIEF